MAQFTIKEDDTLPLLAATLYGPNGDPIDLSALGTSVDFVMQRTDLQSDAVGGEAVIGTGAGQVRYEWAPGDTSVAGDYIAEFRVTFPSGRVETWPNDGYILISVSPKLPRMA